MIKLSVHSKSNISTFVFDKATISIGSGLSTNVDLALSDENIQDIHIKILEKNNRYIALNYANDPFATLNNLPFGKKQLKNHDMLQLGESTIVFESNFDSIDNEIRETPAQELPSKKIEELSYPEIEKPIPPPHEELTTVKEIEVESKASEQLIDIDSLFEQVEQLDTETITPQKNESNFIKVDPAKEVIISNIIKELDEQNTPEEKKEKEPEAKNPTEKPVKTGFTRMGYFAILLFFIILAVISFIFFNIRQKSNYEKILAAEGVADVSMALAYAQVNHIKPQKQNWFDPEFLKNNLASVVSSDYPSFAHIDNQGHFNNCPYILRIYTSTDLDHFVILAQPAPSVLQWLIPNPTIMVDSRAMELRETNDLRSLNRLLASNTLNNTNGLEVSALIKQGNLIPLTTLANKTGNLEFSPPKALGLIRPHAENYIYNAPRYYHFGEDIMDKAIALKETPGNHYEILRLQQEMAEISRFPDILLYSSQGLRQAIEGQKALAALAPQSKFLNAYLHFNSEGKVTSSHLLLNASYSNFSSHTLETPLNKVAINEVEEEDSLVVDEDAADSLQIDLNNPLYEELLLLSTDREKALRNISGNLNNLLQSHESSPIVDFKSKLHLLVSQYESEDQEQIHKINVRLSHLYQEHADVTSELFKKYLDATNLEGFARDTVLIRTEGNVKSYLLEEDLLGQFHHIQSARNFKDLKIAVNELSSVLSLNLLPNMDQLAILENKFRAEVMDKLNEFFSISSFSSADSFLSQTHFSRENRPLLTYILNEARISKDDADFFLNKFDALSAP